MQRRREVYITAIERSEPDVRLLVLALIEAAREVQAREAQSPADGSEEGADE